MIACYLRITLVVSRTIYRESFTKENFHDMSIVTAFANLVIQLKVFSDYRCDNCDYKKMFTNSPRFAKSANIFFHEQFSIYGILVVETDCFTNLHTNLLMSPAEGR